MRYGINIRSHERCYRDPIKTLSICDQYLVPVDLSPDVKQGDLVQEGQLIVEDNKVDILSHSPVTGIVQGIEVFDKQIYVNIQPNREMKERRYNMIDPFKLDVDVLLENLRICGVLGVGSHIPLHQRIRDALRNTHTILVNGLDSEPFLSFNHQIISEFPKEMIRGAQLLKTMLGAENIVIAIRKDVEAKRAVDNFVFDTTVDIRMFPNRYPIGYDRLLVREISGHAVSASDNLQKTGYFVLGAASLMAFYNALFLQKPMIENIMTIDGIYCLEYGNFRVKIGTPLSVFMRPFAGDNSCKMFTTGPIHGHSIDSEVAVSKLMNSIIISEHSEDPIEQDCISCIACNIHCPIGLEPYRLFDMVLHKEWALLESNYLQECISCNLCSYVCPCFIPLGETITTAKNEMHGVTGYKL